MSVSWGVKVFDGRRWHVGSNICSSADIIIPVGELDGMDDADIGKTVRFLVRHARLAQAAEVASMVGLDATSTRWDVYAAQAIVERVGEDASLLEEFEGEDEDVRRGYEIYREAMRLVEMKRQGDRTKKTVRRDQAARYDSLFVTVGNRDGFKCDMCGATEHLTLDHIHPISLGGTNDLDNLRLLCRSHNSSKGARLTDESRTA